MKILFKISLLTLVFTILLNSCKEESEYSEIPEIELKSTTVNDVLDTILGDNIIRQVSITFSVIDGDGDIGLDSKDTLYPYNDTSIYYNNLFITLFAKQNGYFEEVTDLKIPYYYRMPYVGNITKGNVLIADISTHIDYVLPVSYDTVYYELYICDRELNHSNTIVTDTIFLNN